MCLVSNIMDAYKPHIPQAFPYSPPSQGWPAASPSLRKELDELRQLIDSFHRAVEAAKEFDRLTGQPDCVDPEKAVLEQRVAELEAKLAAVQGALES